MNDPKERQAADAFGLLTRRAFVQGAGTGLIILLASREIWADPARRAPRSPFPVLPPFRRAARITATPAGALQLPFWGDGAGWDQPEYYPSLQAGRRLQVNRTAQNADIDGDGFDELIARGPGGILVHKFDPFTGQWLDMPSGPQWSDANGWNIPKRYLNVMTADIDGDLQAELIGRNPSGIEVWKYDTNPSSPTYQTWVRMPDGPPWQDGWAWDRPPYYPTIQCADVDGDGQDEILGRSTDQSDDGVGLGDPNGGGIQCWKYDKVAKVWNQLAGQGQWTDANTWNLPQHYATIQCADVDGDGAYELLGLDDFGVETWKYDTNPASPTHKTWVQIAWIKEMGSDWWQPQCYLTIQCADIDGDGHAELIGRAPDSNPTGKGIRVYKYVASGPLTGTWQPLTPGPAWTDAAWSTPEYYSTIQCADINGDGRAELIARGPAGIQAWNYDPNARAWSQLPAGPAWSDAAGWNQVQYYSTIQTARAVAQSPNLPVIADPGFESPVVDPGQGFEAGDVGAWTWGSNGSFVGGAGLSTYPSPMITAAGPPPEGKQLAWLYNNPTAPAGTQTYISQQISGFDANVKYVFTFYAAPTAGQPVAASSGCTFDVYLDGTQIGSFSLTDTHYVHLATNPVKPGAGAHTLKFVCTSDMTNAQQPRAGVLIDDVQVVVTPLPHAVLLGRDSLGLKTWKYDPAASQWQQTSTPYPAFIGNQKKYYDHITTALGIQFPDPNDPNAGIRYRYNDLAANIQDWTNDLLGTGPNPIGPPPGVPADDPDWAAVKTQIVNELTWVAAVNRWFGTLTQAQVVATFLADDLTLYTVGPYLNYAATDTTSLSVPGILALIFGGIAALLGFPELEAAAAAAVAGTIAVGCSAAAAADPSGEWTHGYQADYNQLQTQLSNAFIAAYTQSGTIPNTITGGLNGTVYTPGDYGLLAAIGRMIGATVWNWPSGNTALITASQRAYATSVFQFLFANYQAKADPEKVYCQAYYDDQPNAAPPGFPNTYLYLPNGPFLPGFYYWLQLGPDGINGYPPTTTLQALFDTPQPNATNAFPLGVPIPDFYTGQNGWPTLQTIAWHLHIGQKPRPPLPRAPRPSLDADVRVTVLLTRDAITGRLDAAVTLTNRGMTAANNVELTLVSLGNLAALTAPPARHVRLGPGRQVTHDVEFPAPPAGQRTVLRVTGRHLEGAFGISLRVTVP